MAQNYTRQSAFSDGDTITATLFNDEYNQLVNTFNYSSSDAGATGHRHDGSSGQGGNIFRIGDLDFFNKIEADSSNNRWGFYVEVGGAPVEQLRIQDGVFVPVTDNDIDIGSPSAEFKNLYLDGTATIDTLVVDETATIAGAVTFSSTLTVAGNATFNGNTTIGNAATDTVTITADVASNLIPSADSTYTLGDATNYWSSAYVDSITTTGNVSVGGDLTVTGNATISGNLTFGDADTDTVSFSADVSSHILPDVTGTYDLGSATKEWRNLYIDGTANIDSLVADTADINGGTIDGATIATSDVTVGAGKTLDVSAGTLTLADNQISGDKVEGGTIAAVTITSLDSTTVDTTNIEVTNLKAKDGTAAGSIADSTGVVTIASSVLTTTDINGGTIDGVTIGGSSAGAITGTTITGTSFVSSGDMTFGDNDKAIFGAGSDLSVYHDGSNSYISEAGTGNLIIGAGAGVLIKNKDLDENLLSAYQNGAVELFYDNAEKLATTASGIDVTGTATTDGLTIDGGNTLRLDAASTTDFFTIIQGGTQAVLTADSPDGAGNMLFRTAAAGVDTDRMQIASNGDISFYEDTGTTAKLTWDASAESLNFADNAKAIFGAGSDLQIYHDGSMNYIDDAGNGDLRIRANNDINFRNYSNDTTVMNLSLNNGSEFVQLYYAGSQKLATTSTGIDVTGTVTADGLTVDGNTASQTYRSSRTDGDVYIQATTDADFVRIGTQTKPKLFNVDGNGDISFYESTGSTAKFFWDASAEALGIGTTSPSALADIYDSASSSSNDLFHVRDYLGGGSDKTRLIVKNGGNVGIGESNPSDTLELSGGNIVNPNSTGSEITSATFGLGQNIHLEERQPNGAFSDRTDLAIVTNSGFGLGESEKVRLTASGNVGIGTSSPSQPLHVDATGGTTAALFDNNGTNGDVVRVGKNGTDILKIRAEGTADLALDANGGAFIFKEGGTEAMRIDSSGNVGIGTSSPAQKLHVYGANATAFIDAQTGTVYPAFQIGGSGTPYFSIDLDLGTPTVGGTLLRTQGGAYPLRFGVDTTERMRIDSSGNLLVGKSTSDVGATDGFEWYDTANVLTLTRTTGNALSVNRLSTDGAIVTFRKDGTTVGTIGTTSGRLYIGDGDVALRFADDLDFMAPWNASTNAARDAAIDLGNSGNRFKDLYLSGGVYLGGTGAANQLDDYEEGTFNVSLTFGGASTGVTYTTRSGRYIKIGKLVYINIALNLSNKGTSTGDAKVTGLPFTQSADGVNYPNLSLRSVAGITFTNCLYATANDGTTEIQLMDDNGSGTQTNLTDSDFTTGAEFNITGVYESA